MDDGYIQDMLEWIHPHISDQSAFQYTEKENMEMLRLPRKECTSFYEDKPCHAQNFHRYCDRNSNPRPLPHTNNIAFCLLLRLKDITARPYTRKRMDYLHLDSSFFCFGPTTFCPLCKWVSRILSRWAEGDSAAVVSTTVGLPLISFFYSCREMSGRSRVYPKARETANHALPFGDERYSRPPRCLLHLQQNLGRWLLRLDSV